MRRPTLLNLAQRVQSLWVNASRILGRRSKPTVVVCPVVELPAETHLDENQRIESCSRWPELESDCKQSCLSQVEFSSEDSDDFAARYEGKKCASCGSELTRDDWYKNRMASLNTNTTSPDIPRSFHAPDSGTPVCSTCYSAKAQQ